MAAISWSTSATNGEISQRLRVLGQHDRARRGRGRVGRSPWQLHSSQPPAGRGHRYTGEKMKQLKPRPKRAKVAAVQETDRAGLPRTHVPSRRAVMAAADRAEERSKRNRQSRPGKLTERLPSYSPLGAVAAVSRLRRSADNHDRPARGAAYLPAAACGRSVEVPCQPLLRCDDGSR
jgi:hypothetical protein